MELRHIRYFIAVAENMSISRAAQELLIAQPPLSRQIRDLEDELGADLFERTPQGLRITPEGKMYVLELNTSPGMTGHSLVPKAAAKVGIDLPQLCDRILRAATHD